jgi:hypothetical protein
MSILTIPWSTLSTNALASADTVDTDAPFMTVGWVPKQGGMPLPYLDEDRAVTAGADVPSDPGTPTPVVVFPAATADAGDAGDASGASTEAPSGDAAPPASAPVAPVPGQVRPADAPVVTIAKRRNRKLYVADGIQLKLDLDQTARIEAVLVASTRHREHGKLTGSARVEISGTVARTLKAGRTVLVLKPSAAGRRALKALDRLTAKLELDVVYADGSRVRVTRTILLTPPPKKKS